jgi:hypothetical protein
MVTFAPDGTTFATGADDQAIVLWDAESGTPRNRLLPGADGSMEPSFRPDGNTLLISSSHGEGIYELDLRPEHWLDVACAIAGRNLTQEEWSDAFGDRPHRDTCPRQG